MKRAEIMAVYQGSNGEATKALYAKLESVGPAGVIAAETIRKHAPNDSITLVGEEAEPRREFIENYAHQVKNLDV